VEKLKMAFDGFASHGHCFVETFPGGKTTWDIWDVYAPRVFVIAD
jgi:hypothetical protein